MKSVFKVTSKMLDQAVIEVCKTLEADSAEIDREYLAETLSRSPEFMEWAHITTAKLSSPATFTHNLAVIFSALCVGMEIGVKLAEELEK